jgi:hypothetical protein
LTVRQLVRLAGAVLDEGPAVATRAASPQLGVELLQQLRGHLTDRLVTERRIEVHAGVLLVARPSGLLDLVRPQPRLHRRPEGRLGLGVLLLVDLGGEPAQDATRFGLVGRRLAESEIATGERILTGVDDHLERLSPLTDHAAGTTGTGLGHSDIVPGATAGAIDRTSGLAPTYLRWSRWWRRGESNP